MTADNPSSVRSEMVQLVDVALETYHRLYGPERVLRHWNVAVQLDELYTTLNNSDEEDEA